MRDRGDGRVHVKEKDFKVRENAVIATSRGVVLGCVPHQTQHTVNGFSLVIIVLLQSCLPFSSHQEREIRRQRVAQQREVDNQRRAQERTMRLLAHLRQQEIDRDRR